MAKIFKKIIHYLKYVNVIIFILFFYGLIFLISSSAIAITDLYCEMGQFRGSDLSKLSYLKELIVVVFAVPIIETIIYQYLVIKVSKYFLKNEMWAICLSSFCFGLSHLYSLPYFITGILVGLVFAGCFTLAEYRKESSWILVALVHALYNLSAIILNHA